ncbi:GNAT family N-acetyltransferase [Lentzea sp. NPDC034063]|uniref:GNAT family N-acetyltransferase n=1 Tax=unclassified Lentzea TaxID=2643253 RepID=UPI0033E1F7D1
MTAPEIVSPAPRDVWQSIVDHDVAGTPVSQSPQWRDAVCGAWRGRDVSRLYRWDDGTSLVVPLVRGRLRPAAMAEQSSWPLGWGIGGALSYGELCEDKADAVVRDLMAQPVRSTYLRPDPRDDAVWRAVLPPAAVANPRMTQVLDLSGGFGHVWKHRYTSARRNDVRRAERAGLDVEVDDTGRFLPLFERFYRQAVDRWARRDGVPLVRARWQARRRNPPRKFAAVVRHLGPACRLWVASLRGEPVAVTMMLHQGTHVTYWQSAMDKEIAARSCAVPYLVSLAIEQACAEGGAWFSFGDTHPGTSVTRFKTGFGPTEHHSAGYWIPGAGRSGRR